jgi:hypothetical protein
MLNLNKGLDVGTAFCGCCWRNETGEDIYRFQRDCFLEIEATEDSRRMLEKSNANFIESSDKTNIYILGDDALNFANILEGSKKTIHYNDAPILRRPMKSGVLNPNEPELAFSIMRQIIRGLLDKPREHGEKVCFSVPADPIDADFNNMYHQRMLEGIIEKLGYSPKPINEGLAVIYSTNPTITTEDDEEIPFSGLGISFGGGQCNVCFAYRSYPLIQFSVANAYGMNQGSGGDWIDTKVAEARSDISISKVTKFKEKYADFTKDPAELAKEISNGNRIIERRNFEILIALDLYYRKLIEYILLIFEKEFSKQKQTVEEPIEIVVAGGTSSPNGFEEIVMQEVNKMNLPFVVKGVRKATNPLYTVAHGCLISSLV